MFVLSSAALILWQYYLGVQRVMKKIEKEADDELRPEYMIEVVSGVVVSDVL